MKARALRGFGNKDQTKCEVNPIPVTMAAMNKSLARNNKSRTGAEATKKRLDRVHDEHSALANAAT
jgi:hypothetical protein